MIAGTGLGRLPMILDTEQDAVVLEVGEGAAIRPDLVKLMLSGANVELNDVVLETPAGNWTAAKLGPFMPDFSNEDARQSPGTTSLLGKAMFPPLPLAINRLRLTPYSSRLVFGAETQTHTSEIWFACPHRHPVLLTLDAPGEVNIGSVGGEDGLFRYIVVNSEDIDVAEVLTPLTLTLSLLMRRRASHLAIQHGGKVEINLASPSRTNSMGSLVKRRFLPKAAQPLFDYLRSEMPDVSEAAAHFLIEGLSNPGTLEVRLLNAFVYLEVIDGTDTLDKVRLAKRLGISVENAEAIKHVRNAMSHKGLGIVEAIRSCRKKMGTRAASSILGDLESLSSPHGEFYSALMDLLSQHLLHLIGVPEGILHRNAHASFGRNGAELVLPA